MSRSALTYVTGWNDWTRRISLVVLSLSRKRYVIWTDTPDCSATARHKLRNLFLRILSARAVAVLSTGKPGMDGLRKMGIPASKIVNFPCWVRLPNDVRPGRKSRRAVRYCCIGRLVGYKNFACAIRALALLPEGTATLDIIGSGPELDALRRIAVAGGVEGRVRFRGFLDEVAVAKYLREEGECLIHPASRLEPFGVVIAEAMAHGLPVIASDQCGAAADRIKDGENGFLLSSPVETEPLASKMRLFIESPASMVSMGIAARRTAEEWPIERAIRVIGELASFST